MSNMMPSNYTDRGQVLRPTESGWGGGARLWALVWAGVLVLGLLLTLAAPSASAQGKTILIVAPHPDDETLCCAGVISAALASGNTVKVVVVTNGDAVGGTSTGLTREARDGLGDEPVGADRERCHFSRLWRHGAEAAV